MVSKEALVKKKIVCVVGLGYVGMPLVEAFARHVTVIGYDNNGQKVARLQRQHPSLTLTSDPSQINKADVVIIAVPTPVTKSKEPDLYPVISASETVGKHLKRHAIVVLESTVYPGTTEDVVVPILERLSGSKCGVGFKVGYSPERVNPGDDNHSIDRIVKVVSGMDPESTAVLSGLYGLITTVHVASSIKIAEAAKVIENVQRDLNIALMNELSIIFSKLGIDTKEVLDAASTKWNFIRYNPGLVGGHCIPVDPYYLVFKARELGYHPQVILAGRSVNDAMAKHVAEMAIKGINETGRVIKNANVLIMGLTYKENVPDTRESPVKEMVKELEEYGCHVYGRDPLLNAEEIASFGVRNANHGVTVKMDCVIVAVAHDQFKRLTFDDMKKTMTKKPVLIDVRRMYDPAIARKKGFTYYTL